MTMKNLMLAGILVAISPPIISASAQDTTYDLQAASQSAPTALSLDEAIARALKHSPVLGAQISRADAASASRSQAGALPNPQLSIEAENIFGDGPYQDLDAAEMTYEVSQLIELPGKRSNRVRVAQSEEVRSHLERDAARLNLVRDVAIAYAEAVAAVEEQSIQQEQRNLALAVLNSVSAKVEAGKEPPIQKNKAAIALSASDIALDRAQRAVGVKLHSLAALLGEDLQSLTLDTATLPALTEPLPLTDYQHRLSATPDALSFEANVTRARSALSYERANAFPDPTLNFGVRDFREDDEQAFVAGVSLPIPVFNMNRAGIDRAGHELNAVMLDQRSGTLSLNDQLIEAYAGFVDAYHEATTLKSTVLPGAEDAFAVAREGYASGKFGYLDMLDAQRTLFETRQQYSAAVLDYQRQRAIIERMTAVHADNDQASEEKQ